jgi:uncharacterized protein (DUF58 family)
VSGFFFPLILILMVMAALLREDFIFTLLYLFAGAYAIGRWWSRRALRNVAISREFQGHAFIGETVPVHMRLTNQGWLPVVWIRLQESLPVDLAVPNFFRQVVSLGPKESLQLEYWLSTRKRGYYPIGPLSLTSGDLLAMSEPYRLELQPEYLTVYPKIIPLTKVPLPSHSPLGTLRHTQPIFEDPSRVMGKRDYVAGDSLRRVDWKASAVAGRLQVKQFEPSIALETAIILNLNSAEYAHKGRFYATELAIVAAASLASWVAGRKQSVGLITNGLDPASGEGGFQPLPPRKGRAQLIRLLEVLARVEMGETESLESLFRRETAHLSWGNTLVVITGEAQESLFDQLFQARRKGLEAILVLCGQVIGVQELKRRAGHFGIGAYHLVSEKDLDVWRSP